MRISVWISDVCSSDLPLSLVPQRAPHPGGPQGPHPDRTGPAAGTCRAGAGGCLLGRRRPPAPLLHPPPGARYHPCAQLRSGPFLPLPPPPFWGCRQRRATGVRLLVALRPRPYHHCPFPPSSVLSPLPPPRLH